MRIQTRIALLLMPLCVIVVVGLSIYSTISLDEYFHSRLTNELDTQTRQAEFVMRNLIASDSTRYEHLQRYSRSANLRLTLIDLSGAVLFDSEIPEERIAAIENHLHRPEDQQALRAGTGSSTRHSGTINEDLLYLPRRISEPFPAETGFSGAAFIRAAVPLTQVDEVTNGIRSK